MRLSFRAAIALGLVASAQSVAAAEEIKLSLADAVRTAIANDADLYIAREDVEVAGSGVLLARAVFTPRVFGEVYGSRDDLAPTATSFPAIDSKLAGSIGVSGRVQTGLTYTVSAGLLRESYDDPFSSVYKPATTSTVRAEIVQPLLRGGFSAARRPITVASLRRTRSEQELRARIETSISDVVVAYWNFVRVRAERDARASAVQLAMDQVDESQRLLRLGTGTDLDVVEAQAGVSRRRQELLRTERDALDAEGALFAALRVRADETAWSGDRVLVPTEVADIEPATEDLAAQLELARTRRADVISARDLTAAEVAALDVTDDARRPSLDLVAAAGTVGFGGSLASSYATAGINGTGLAPPYTADRDYQGGPATSLKNLAGKNYGLYVGLRFEVPLGANEAEVRYQIQQRTVGRARLAERATLARIESEVRTSVSSVRLGSDLVAAADRSVELSEKLLEGMRKRFHAGASTTFDVLRVSDEVTRARVEAARARADYRVSLTRLAAATGTLLDSFGVTTKSLGAAPK